SSHEEADGQPAKRAKCEKSSPKSELEGLTCGSGNLAVLGEVPKASDGDRGSEGPGDTHIIQQKKGESVPETDQGKQDEHDVSLEPHALKASSTPLRMGIGGYLHHHVFSEEESSCGSVLAEESGSEDMDRTRRHLQLEHSGFSDEDSNQPMPVHRFFGDSNTLHWTFLNDFICFLQDLPAVALPSTTMSRREVRNLHFIAKEDEEEEEE
ncbi:CA174 protein, partial [Furnarius figulus]|nr:CA174 protein [Furnarius figulus]